VPFFRVYINLNVRVGWIGIGIFYPSGESILMHLLRYRAFAVDNHSCMPCALHLHQPRLVNNPGYSATYPRFQKNNLHFEITSVK
jgi:hypothetical protein